MGYARGVSWNGLAALGALNAGIAVAAGAFGAHALQRRLSERHLEIFEVAVRYQMAHALGMLAAAWILSRGGAAAGWAGWLFLAGTVVFSGSLYTLALTGMTRLGMVTPLGGLAFLAGWVCLALGALRAT